MISYNIFFEHCFVIDTLKLKYILILSIKGRSEMLFVACLLDFGSHATFYFICNGIFIINEIIREGFLSLCSKKKFH